METLLCPIDLMSSDEIQEEHHQAPVVKSMDLWKATANSHQWICPSSSWMINLVEWMWGGPKRPRDSPNHSEDFFDKPQAAAGNPIQNTTLTKPTALVTVELCQKKRFDHSVETRPLIFGPAGTGANDGFCWSCKSV